MDDIYISKINDTSKNNSAKSNVGIKTNRTLFFFINSHTLRCGTRGINILYYNTLTYVLNVGKEPDLGRDSRAQKMYHRRCKIPTQNIGNCFLS